MKNRGIRTKNIIGILTVIVLIFSSFSVSFGETRTSSTPVTSGETRTSSTPAASKAKAYIKPNVTVTLWGEPTVFKDTKGNIIYPIIYNGSTYLPVRSISIIMGEDIEWDNYSKTVYIGKTLSNPNKTKAKTSSGAIINNNQRNNKNIITVDPNAKDSLVTIYVRPNFTILYDFAVQSFKDANENVVYPVVYEGSTYLPVRAISGIMGVDIVWDSGTKTVAIGTKEDLEQKAVEKSAATRELKELYYRQVEVYEGATNKIKHIKEIGNIEELKLLAVSVSADYGNAQKYCQELKGLEKASFTDEEFAAYKKLCDFAEITEYYILVLENITYMAASGEDYSMFAETFLQFALESSQKLEAARVAIEAL